jgi:nitrite reductase/ring-hydroxylating ferredoxin subunit
MEGRRLGQECEPLGIVAIQASLLGNLLMDADSGSGEVGMISNERNGLREDGTDEATDEAQLRVSGFRSNGRKQPAGRESGAAVTPTRRSLAPHPTGWYALAFSDELTRGKTLARTLAGVELVLFRTESGQPCAMEAYCPHLGAHLGYGGRVEGEQIRCPFHGFRFDTGGQCVATGYGTKPPPTAKIRTWPLREMNGILLAALAPEGGAPSWEVPPLDMTGWSPMIHRRFVLASHPQETTENSVDLGHFAAVHGYESVRTRREAVTNGAYLSTAYAAKHVVPVLSRLWPGLRVDFEFDTHIFGLGYSLVEVRLPGFEVRARLWVLPTPIDGERIALCLATSGNGRDVHRWLTWLPAALRGALIARVVGAGLIADASRDFVIWEHKRYIERPALVGGDGPIGKYRAWAAQFYEASTATQHPAPHAAHGRFQSTRSIDSTPRPTSVGRTA